MDEHKQRVQALEEAEYNAYDEKRAKAADELMWMDFETRMRSLMKKVVEPALQLSIEDREANIELDIKYEKIRKRTELLEQAVFKKNDEVAKTIFDEYNERMSEMNIFLRTESKRLSDT